MSVIGVRANRLSDGADIAVDLAEETAIAITYDGTTQAVPWALPPIWRISPIASR